jgi:hypothetical protein
MIMNILLLAALMASPTPAQTASPAAPQARLAWPANPAARLAAQREAMKALAFMDGTWRGPAKAEEAPAGLTQTERVGDLLGGSVKLVEGRGYDGAGRTVFNAFAIISYDPVKQAYLMRSHAMGYAADFPLTVSPDGFSWTRPEGPGASTRYTTTIKGGEWHEIGERIVGDKPPVKTFEMRLRRLGATAWPLGEPVAPR